MNVAVSLWTAIAIRLHSRRFIALFCVLIVASAFYYWSGTSSGNPIVLGHAQTDFYNQFADGLLHGHLYLPTPVPKALLDLPNPYAPPCCDLAYWDTSLFHDKLFIEYGPAPVLTLFIPWRILHLGDMPLNLEVIIFSIVALAFGIKCLTLLVDRYLPSTPTWKVTLGAIMLAFGGDAAFLLRNPNIYEASVIAGVAFTVIGLYFLGSGALGDRPILWRLALGSLGVSLALGSHADLVVLVALVALAAFALLRRHWNEGRGTRLRLALATLGPMVLCGVLYGEYNLARFGSLLQTGESYDVGGNGLHKALFEPQAIVGGIYWYFLAPARLALAFPYIALPPPPQGPVAPIANNIQEPIAGILAIVPITLFLLVLPFLFLRRGRRELGVILLALTVVGVGVAFVVSTVGPEAVRYTIRLEADFATILIIPALAVWFLVGGRQWYRRILTGIGAVLIAIGSIVGVAISITGYYNGLFYSNHSTYEALEEATSFIPTAMTMLIGHPVISRVVAPAGLYGYITNYTTLGAANDLSFYVSPSGTEVDIVSPSNGTFYLKGSMGPGTAAPKGARLSLTTINNGHRHREVVTQPGMRSIPLQLVRGLNRVSFSARPSRRAAVPTAAEVGISAIQLVAH